MIKRGGYFGVRIKERDRERYFDPQWKSVEVELDGDFITVPLSRTFWTTCPELRREIDPWLKSHAYIPYPKGYPPHLDLIPLGGDRFRLTTV